MKRIYLALLIVLSLAYSCMEPAKLESGALEQSYYDVQALLDKQLSLLEEQGAQLQKSALINGKQEEGKPTEVNWKKELKLFGQLDINKPVLLRSYSRDTLKEDGMKTITYQALDDELKVRKVVIGLDSNSQPISLQGTVQEENAVYLARRKMTMRINAGKIQSCQLEGFQKVTTQDTMKYILETKVIW